MELALEVGILMKSTHLPVLRDPQPCPHGHHPTAAPWSPAKAPRATGICHVGVYPGHCDACHRSCTVSMSVTSSSRGMGKAALALLQAPDVRPPKRGSARYFYAAGGLQRVAVCESWQQWPVFCRRDFSCHHALGGSYCLALTLPFHLTTLQ